MISTKLTKVILVGFVTLTANASLAGSYGDMKPYIEAQINYMNPDDVSSNTLSASAVSGSVTASAGIRIKNEYKNETSAGVEFGVSVNNNSRIGFAYSRPKFELDKIGLNLSATLTDGTTTITGTASGKFSRADLATVAPADTFDNEVKLYSMNYYYDFDLSSEIKPFLGFGIGIADIENAKDKELALSLHGGAKYYLADKVYLGGKASYSQIQGPTDGFGFKYEDIDFWTATLALGYEF
jgi:opacity protein-like surface antigen